MPKKRYFDNFINKATAKYKPLKQNVTLAGIIIVFFEDKKNQEIISKFKKIDYTSMCKELEKYNLEMLKKSEQHQLRLITDFLKGYYAIQRCNEEIITDEAVLSIVNLMGSIVVSDNIPKIKSICEKWGIDEDLMCSIFQNNASDNIIKNINPALTSLLSSSSPSTVASESSDKESPYLINMKEKVSSDKWIHTVGREKEIDLIEQTLERKDKPNVLLIGNVGIGKQKIVEGFVYKNQKYNVYQLDTLALMSNIMVKGEIEHRVKGLIQFLSKKDNNILYISDIDKLTGSQDMNGMDILSLFKSALNESSLKMICTSTFENFRRGMESDDSITSYFYKMIVSEPTLDETRDILNKVSKSYESFFNVKYENTALELILTLAKKYIFDKSFPEKAVDILDMSGAYAKHKGLKIVDDSIIFKTISETMNIPLSNLSQSEEDMYKHLEDKLKEQIIGQDEAVGKVSDAVIISKSGLRESNKTAISLIFKGMTGCGKTQLCQVLSETMGIPLVRFDMSEYMEEHSVSKLIGAPPGYKDSGNGKAGNGLLINAIDEHPYCVLMLDEIEKANSKVHNILLQVMDNGRLTSSTGKQVSFENVFLIMTSNVGSANGKKYDIGFGSKTEVRDNDYNMTFLPEFRSRIDAVVTFNDLSKDVMKKICKKFLKEMAEMLKNKSIGLKYDEQILDFIVDKVGLEDGARPLKRFITNEIKNKIAKHIVFGEYVANDTINIVLQNNELKIELDK